MKSLLIVILLIHTTLLPGAPSPATRPARFLSVDVYVDSKDRPLAAYQLEFMAPAGVQLVGIEGGAPAAFANPPYYDPAALSRNRVILASFNTGSELPRGYVRVARLHLRTADAEGEYRVHLNAAASSDGSPIAAEASIRQGER